MERALTFAIMSIGILSTIALIQHALILRLLSSAETTPEDVMDEIIKAMKLQDGEVLYDLGAGDGRILIAACKSADIKAIGYEISPIQLYIARLNKLMKLGLSRKLQFKAIDLFSIKDKAPDKVYIYLSRKIIKSLNKKLKKLPDTTAVYSYDNKLDIDRKEKEVKLSNGKRLYIYTSGK